MKRVHDQKMNESLIDENEQIETTLEHLKLEKDMTRTNKTH